MRHPLRRFLCLHEAVTLPFVVEIFWPKLTFCDHPFAFRRLPQWNFVLLAVKCHGVSPLSTAVHAFHRSRKCINCLGFSHACDVVYGTSKCKFCEDFHLITLRSRLVRRNLPFFPRRAPGTSAASREAMTWGSDVELEEMESEQTGLAGSSAVHIPSLKGGSCHFSAICIKRSPDPGSSHFPPALLMRRPLTSPASWVLWSRVTPPCRWSRILWPPIFHPLWCLPGTPAPSFLPSRVGPLPLLSGSPTSQPVRQVWPFTQWPSFRPTRRTS